MFLLCSTYFSAKFPTLLLLIYFYNYLPQIKLLFAKLIPNQLPTPIRRLIQSLFNDTSGPVINLKCAGLNFRRLFFEVSYFAVRSSPINQHCVVRDLIFTPFSLFFSFSMIIVIHLYFYFYFLLNSFLFNYGHYIQNFTIVVPLRKNKKRIIPPKISNFKKKKLTIKIFL